MRGYYYKLVLLLLVLKMGGSAIGQNQDTAAATFCNPLNLSYRFALNPPSRRTAADPCITLFKDEYYLTATQAGGYWHSKDLLHWIFVTTQDLPLEIDAPTTVVIGDYLYFFPMSSHIIYRSKDPANGKWEKATDSFPLIEGDPYVFVDTDGRVYYYFGCTNNGYLSAVELDPSNNFKPIGQPVHCITGNPEQYGWERVGDYNTLPGRPWTEASWVTKYKGKYYYQFSAPGTEYKSYADGYYVSDHPLGPFTYSPNSPFSSKPEGFICGAGHSATFQDKHGNWWHIVTMTISVKDKFERRLGLFPATFDNNGNLSVHTELGDYPILMPDHTIHDVGELFPGWMLLSYKKSAMASSSLDAHPPSLAFDEEIRDYWSAQTGNKGEWLNVDLGSESTVKAIQLNFAENNTQVFGRQGVLAQQFLVEYSNDKKTWETLIDQSHNEEDLTHQFHVLKSAIKARYLKVTNYRVPGGTFAISGFRVFGLGTLKKPHAVTALKVVRDFADPRNVRLSWKKQADANGYIIRFGLAKNKLYRTYQVYDSTNLTIHSLNKDQRYWFAIDAFGENGIARGSSMTPEAKSKSTQAK
jgi:xylan 1,4-beta-xylosidase